jgi:hypothetical protein
MRKLWTIIAFCVVTLVLLVGAFSVDWYQFFPAVPPNSLPSMDAVFADKIKLKCHHQIVERDRNKVLTVRGSMTLPPEFRGVARIGNSLAEALSPRTKAIVKRYNDTRRNLPIGAIRLELRRRSTNSCGFRCELNEFATIYVDDKNEEFFEFNGSCIGNGKYQLVLVFGTMEKGMFQEQSTVYAGLVNSQ